MTEFNCRVIGVKKGISSKPATYTFESEASDGDYLIFFGSSSFNEIKINR
jgi:hypothetical protein